MNTIRLTSGDHPIDLRRSAVVERSMRALGDDVDVIAVLVEAAKDPGAYVERLADSLFRQEADAAVCPAGFLSGGVPQGVEVGAVFQECDPSYMCISSGEPDLARLEPGARVASWDSVARAQIMHHFPKLDVRLHRSWSGLFEELRHGMWAAACLPPDVLEAGTRWGLSVAPVDREKVLPAIGQADVAMLTLAGYAHPLVTALNDPATETRLRFECAFWRCAVEVPGSVATARASLGGDMVSLTGVIASADGEWLVRDEGESSVKFGRFVAEDVAESCKKAALVPHDTGRGHSRAAG